MATRPSRNGWRYRANVAARALAASLGAYAVAALTATALARTLPMGRVDAVVAATLIAFLTIPAVAVWAFLARGPWRAWAGVLAASALPALIAWAAGQPA
jgi:hypothetical protein